MLNTGITSLVLLTISLIELVLVSRFFSVEIFGVFAGITLITNFFSALGVSLVSQYSLRRNILIKPLLNKLIVTLAILQTLLSTLFQYIILDSTFIIFSFILLLLNLYIGLYDSHLLRISNIKKTNLSQLAASTTSVLLLILFINLGFSSLDLLMTLLLIKTIIQIIFVADFNYINNTRRKISNKKAWNYYLKVIVFYKGYLYSAFTGYFCLNLDRWMISAFVGTQGLAFYSRTLQILNVPIVFFNRLISKDLQSKLLNEVKVNNLILIIIATSITSAIILYFTASYIVLKFLGEEWESVIVLLKIGVMIIPIRVVFKFFDIYIRAKLSSENFNSFYLITLSVSIGLYLLLIFSEYKVHTYNVLILYIFSLLLSLLLNFKLFKYRGYL